MRTPLASAWAKLDRAQVHIDELGPQLREAVDPNKHPILFKTKYTPVIGSFDGGIQVEHAVIAVASGPTFTAGHALLIGEILGNLRSSLDHAAWVLVGHYVKKAGRKLKEDEKQRIAFPAMRHRTRRKTGGRKKRKKATKQRQPVFLEACHGRYLPEVPDRILLEVIDPYQPYRRTTEGHRMKALRNLSDSDKHRFLTPIASPLSSISAAPLLLGGAYVLSGSWSWHFWPARRDIPRFRGLKAGTKLAEALVVRPDPTKGEVTMQGGIATSPMLPNTGMNATLLLQDIGRVCAEVLTKIERSL